MESPAEIEIRPADHVDATAILQCLTAAFTPHRAEYTAAAFADTVPSPEAFRLRLQQMRVLVATLGGNVVGTVAGVGNAGEGHLRGMAVLPEYQGQGVAAKLLAAIENYLRSQGCQRIILDTTLPLQGAMKFYEKNGYHRSEKIADFFGMPLLEYVKRF
jgi:ribosomal protein S18 acetylase RimI-like enzyme